MIFLTKSMINLIPPEAKKTVKYEYWIRVFTVWGFLLSGVCIIAILLLVPSYVLVESEFEALDHEVMRKSGSEETYTAAEEQVSIANRVARQLDVSEPRTSASEVLAAINNLERSGIDLRTYEISRVDGSIQTVQIVGNAVTREALIDFKEELERSPLFESAAVPISDLARESDLPFSIIISISAIKQDP